MNTRNDAWDDENPDPFVDSALSRFLGSAAEFTDGAIAVVSLHPRGKDNSCFSLRRTCGLVGAQDMVARLWMEGNLLPGSWVAGVGGLLPGGGEEGEGPLPWDDGVSRALRLRLSALERSIGDRVAGTLVLGTAGPGAIPGTVNVFCHASGNVLACTGALQDWADERNERNRT